MLVRKTDRKNIRVPRPAVKEMPRVTGFKKKLGIIGIILFFAWPVCLYAQGENAAVPAARDTPAVADAVCRQDSDCPERSGLVNRCLNAGRPGAVCAYFDVEKIYGTIITDKACAFCSVAVPQEALRSVLLGLTFKVIDYREAAARELLKKYAIDTLPVFILPFDAKKDRRFGEVSKMFTEKDNALLLKKDFSGIFNFLNRKEKRGLVDFFIDFSNPRTPEIFNGLVKLCAENKHRLYVWFVSPREPAGAIMYPQEETSVALAVKHIYPEKFIDYLVRRLKDIKDGTWVNSADAIGLEYKKIKAAADSPDVKAALQDNDKNVADLSVNEGNVILIDNTRMFRILGYDEENMKQLLEESRK